MAIVSQLEFNFEALKERLSQIETAKVLCFACLCAERLAPVAQIWSDDLSILLLDAIEKCWHSSISGNLPLLETPGFEPLEQILKHVLETANRSQGFIIPYVEDAIVATLDMLKYAYSLDVVYAALVALRAHDAVFEFAGRHLQRRSGENMLEAIQVAEVFQLELHYQKDTLDLLQGSDPENSVVQKKRTESQQIGMRFAEQIWQQFDPRAADWHGTKRAYPIGSPVGGVITFFSPAGILIHLGNGVYGIAFYVESGITHKAPLISLRRNVTAFVNGYDDANRRILLGEVQGYEASPLNE